MSQDPRPPGQPDDARPIERKTLLATVLGILLGLAATAVTYYWPRFAPDWSPALERDYAARLRAAYADLQISPDERAGLDRFLDERNALRESAATLEARLLPALDAAERSLARGLDLLRAERLEAARREFRSAVDSDPDNPRAWADLGGTEMLLGNVEAGRSAYDRSLTLAPDDRVTRYNFGLFFIRTGDTESAVEQIARSLAPSAVSSEATEADTLREIRRDVRENPLLAGIRRDPRILRLLGES